MDAGSIGVTPAPFGRPERYRSFPDYPRFPLSDSAELVYSPFTRAAQTLSAVSVRLLQSCLTFATLEDHAARLVREFNLGSAEQGAVLAELSKLAKVGLLVSRTALDNRCRLTSAARIPFSPIATVGIPTRNRADSLMRCLTSYLENGRRHSRSNDYVIVDDSDDPLVRVRNRAQLQSLQDQYGAALYYAGPEDKARFADALVQQSGLPRATVEFGLLNPEQCVIATGSSRNLLLLHAVGDVLLQVDDDTLGRLAPSPAAERGLVFSSRYDPTAFWFLQKDDARALAELTEEDLLGVHEQLLGRSLGDCCAALGSDTEVDLDQTSTAFFRNLGTEDGRVLVTAAGVAGDSGMGSALAFLTLDGTSRARLLRCEQDYRHALTAHQIMRAVPRPTICDGAYCMALNLGLDNRRLLPPFMPVQRNQDGIFAALLRGCRGDGFFGFLPWVLLHLPPARRQSSELSWKDALRLRSGQIIQTLLRSITLRLEKSSPAENLRVLGKAVTDMGSMPAPDFEEMVRLQVWRQMSAQASQFAGRFRQFAGQPDYWANDVRQVLAALAEELPGERSAVPVDLDAGRDDRGATGFLQRLVLRLGQLLQVWPDMVESARELRARGVRPASKV